jgi:hypothetical protein
VIGVAGRALATTAVAAGLLGASLSPASPRSIAKLRNSSEGERSSRKPDLQIALHDGRKCGAFTTAIAGLVAMRDAVADDESPAVRICVKAGVQGSVNLRVADLLDTETACTGSEAQVDASCADGDTGELSTSLLEVLTLERTCGRAVATVTVPLRQLLTHPSEGVPIEPGSPSCVVMRTRYAPVGTDAAHAAQTDRATWRFVFVFQQR